LLAIETDLDIFFAVEGQVRELCWDVLERAVYAGKSI